MRPARSCDEKVTLDKFLSRIVMMAEAAAASALSVAGGVEGAAPVAQPQMETISAAAALASMPGLAHCGVAAAPAAAVGEEGSSAAAVESEDGDEEAAPLAEEESAASAGGVVAQPGGESLGKRQRSTAGDAAKKKLEAALDKQKAFNKVKAELHATELQRVLTTAEKKKLKKAEEQLTLARCSPTSLKQRRRPARRVARLAATAKAAREAKSLE